MNGESKTIVKSVQFGAVELINNLYWQDSVLHEIKFIRTGSVDQVILLIDLTKDEDSQEYVRTEVVFHEIVFKAITVKSFI